MNSKSTGKTLGPSPSPKMPNFTKASALVVLMEAAPLILCHFLFRHAAITVAVNMIVCMRSKSISQGVAS